MGWIIFALVGYIASAIALAISCWTHKVEPVIINAISLPLNTLVLMFWVSEYRRQR